MNQARSRSQRQNQSRSHRTKHWANLADNSRSTQQVARNLPPSTRQIGPSGLGPNIRKRSGKWAKHQFNPIPSQSRKYPPNKSDSISLRSLVSEPNRTAPSAFPACWLCYHKIRWTAIRHFAHTSGRFGTCFSYNWPRWHSIMRAWFIHRRVRWIGAICFGG
jgi:hypothetical protein